MGSLLKPLRQLGVGLIALAGLIALVVLGPAAMQALQTQYWPVLHDWRPTVIEHSGDITVVGTMRKHKWPACEYVPPQRVLDLDTGAHLEIVSYSATSGQNWPGSSDIRQFGPWVVAGGAGKRLQFYSEHECSPLWRSFSVLGVVDTREHQRP